MSKVLIVTGGGRGIGKATSILAAEKGWDVCIAYASDAAAAEKVKQQIEAMGRKALAVKADVGKEDDVVAPFKAADALGPLKGLVNNAGIMYPPGRVEDINADKLQKLYATNVFGPILCSREAIRRMSTKHGGTGGAIVNVTSVVAHLGGPGRNVDYGTTKAAMELFTLGLGREVADEGIRVNAVRPGPTRTEMLDNPLQAGRLEEMAKVVPMKRVGKPEEIAAPIVWLLSDEASFVVGTSIIASGGR